MGSHQEANETYDAIINATENGNIEEAHRIADSSLEKNPADAMLHYLRGNLYMKTEEWGRAMSNFKRSLEIDAESPAGESLRMLTDIMNFFNKDMYNQ